MNTVEHTRAGADPVTAYELGGGVETSRTSAGSRPGATAALLKEGRRQVVVDIDTGSTSPQDAFLGLGGEQRFRTEVERVTAAAGTSDGWLEELRCPLRRLYPYDAAWIAWRVPGTDRYVPVMEDGETAALSAFFATGGGGLELQRLGFYRAGWPLVVHRAPVALAQTSAWRDQLTQAGFRDGVGAGLFAADGRHVGFLALLTHGSHTVTATATALLHTVTPLLGSALDCTLHRGEE